MYGHLSAYVNYSFMQDTDINKIWIQKINSLFKDTYLILTSPLQYPDKYMLIFFIFKQIWNR